MQRVRPAARIQPETCRADNRRATLLTAKIGRIMAGSGKIAGKMLPATGKKTGKIMHITPVKTGKNTGTTTITAAVTMEEVTMEAVIMEEDTRRGEYSQAWRSAL